jgi:mannose-6-phosphate isomerase-like protein (cupin superfamily)
VSTKAIVATDGPIRAMGASFTMHEWAHGEMGGPPLHVHHNDDEAWHVLEGTLTFRFADGTAEARAGSTVFVPAGVAHTFGSPVPVRYLIVTTKRVNDLIDALHAPDAGDDQAAIYRRYDSEIVE